MLGWIRRWREKSEEEVESAKALFEAAATSIARGETTEEQAAEILYEQLKWIPPEVRCQTISNILRKWIERVGGHQSVIAEITTLMDELGSAQGSEEQEKAKAKVLSLAEHYPEDFKRAYDTWEERWTADFVKALEGNSDIDVSQATLQLREQMGWPQSGSVRNLLGASEDLAAARDYVEIHGGQVPLKEAIGILAALDPEGPEARFLSYRAKRNLPPL